MGRSWKQFTTEKIIGILREADVALAQGMQVGEIYRKLEVSEQSYYRWRREYGGLRASQAKRDRLWLKDGSCVRLRCAHRDHVWSYDFVSERTRVVGAFPDGQSALMLCAARLRHIAGSKWGQKRYLNMVLLKDQELKHRIEVAPA